MDPNLLKNQNHYNQIYGNTVIEDTIQKVQNFELFLDHAIKTDTSWNGLYYGDFRYRLEGKRVLELGCGDGLNALIMAALGADVVAIDISSSSETIIQQANLRLGTSVKGMTGDFGVLDFPSGSFDFVVGKAFLHHLTYEQEAAYLAKTSAVLKNFGEARFFEPAVNSTTLDRLRWIIPVPGRPSIFNKQAFQIYKENDPHPMRDNSTQHFQQVGLKYFKDVEIVFNGSIERLSRLLPPGKFNSRFRRWALRIEPRLPQWFRYTAARSQLILYHKSV